MIDFSSLGALMALALFTEATVQLILKDTSHTVGKIINNTNPTFSAPLLRLLSALVGVLYACNMGLDIFVILGYPSKYSAIGTIATGLIASRGSNFLHDLTSLIIKNKNEIIV